MHDSTIKSVGRGEQHCHPRLKDQGKPDKVARVAAARKLLLLAHAIYESGEEFRALAQKVT
jgi:hypothetical protein